MIEIICAVLASLSTVTVAIVGGLMARTNRKAEARAKVRQEESLLSMEMMKAVGMLCIGTALAVKNGKANGEMEEGLSAVKEANSNYVAFMRRTTAYQVGK